MMTGSTHFKCECQHCHEHLECPREACGLTSDCPHCGQPTELNPINPQQKISSPARKIIFSSIALLIALVVGLAGFAQNEKRKEQLRVEAAETTRLAVLQAAEAEIKANDPLARAGWSAASISMEKATGSTIIHVLGKLRNETDRRRFGVKVLLELFDAAGQKIGTASDYQPAVEPHAQWQFSALVVNAKAVTAKVAAVEEAP